jgi:hypothetical protein
MSKLLCKLSSPPQKSYKVWALLLILLFFYSCKKDQHLSQNIDDPIVNQAKEWYEKTYTKTSDVLVTNSVSQNKKVNLSNLIKPDWIGAKISTKLNKEVIELPIYDNSNFATGFNNSLGNNILYKKENSLTRFLILKEGNSYKAYVMIIFADTSYMKNDRNKLVKNTFENRDKNFNGIVTYFTPNGDFVSGWHYKKGVLYKLNKSTNSSTQRIQALKPALVNPDDLDCDDYYIIYYYNGIMIGYEYLGYFCTGGGDGGGGDGFPPPDWGGGPSTPDNIEMLTPIAPCEQKNLLNNRSSDATISNINNQVLSQTISSGHEYGAEQNLANIWGNSYKNISPRTDNLTGSFTPQFSWDPTGGYTIGVTHAHPGGTAPSPADAVWAFSNLSNPNLANASIQEIGYYMQNIAITTETSNSTYIITIKDWTALKTMYDNYNSNPSGANAAYVSTAASHSGSAEYALLSLYGNAINLYKAPAGSTAFVPLMLDTNGNIANKPCP